MHNLFKNIDDIDLKMNKNRIFYNNHFICTIQKQDNISLSSVVTFSCFWVCIQVTTEDDEIKWFLWFS